jgi:hypothetical protein
MSELIDVKEGGFSFLKGGLAYSQGVVAAPGYAIEHFRFRNPVPVAYGFRFIKEFIERQERPLNALCAVELRSPKPLSIDGFKEFNRAYAAVLDEWGLVKDGINAVARSNVAPVLDPPDEPGFFAFAITVPAAEERKSFVVAGSSEWPEGGRFPEDVVRYGDTSAPAMREKADYVLAAMERRMGSLGVGWEQASVTQSYSKYDVFDFLTNAVAARCGGGGIVMHYCRPPVAGWEYEMDVKGVGRTEWLEA